MAHEDIQAQFQKIYDAKDDLQALPGWATWTAGESAAWIESNVTDLASAKTALKALARIVVYLRILALGD